MTVKIGRWSVPGKLLERYVRIVDAAEKSSERYNYDFELQRQSLHSEIVEHVGLLSHTRDYREFQRALQDVCEEMSPSKDQYPQPVATKLTPPVTGMLRKPDAE